MENISVQPKREYYLDLLKALSIIFVLIWHLHPITVKYLAPSSLGYVIFLIVDAFERQITLTAVPCFIFVSLFLLQKKVSADKSYVITRLVRLVKVYLFWIMIQIILYFILAKFFINAFAFDVTDFPSFSVKDVLMGFGPSLPLVGGSVFYFLFDLIILTFLCWLVEIFNFKYLSVVYGVLMIVLLLYFEYGSLNNQLVLYWQLQNFIIYIPGAYFWYHHRQKIIRFKYFYLAAYLCFSIHDLYLQHHLGFDIGSYARVSIFLGTLTLASFASDFKVRALKFVQITARYSLGIFAVHKYWMILALVVFHQLFLSMGASTSLYFHSLKFDLFTFCSSMSAVVFSIILVYLLAHTRLRQYIS